MSWLLCAQASRSMVLLHGTSVQPCALLVSKEGLYTVALPESGAGPCLDLATWLRWDCGAYNHAKYPDAANAVPLTHAVCLTGQG